MKISKTKDKVVKTIWKKASLFFAVLLTLGLGFTFGDDIISQIFPDDTADAPGSNGSVIQTGAGTSEVAYVNKWNNSTVVGNFFQGYYYDTLLGFFRLDWSSNVSENVSIVGSTWACPSGYGYKLWGYAYSETAGLIDFDYSGSVFVYYCEVDKSLHGFAYSDIAWLQNFEGIGFEIIPNIWTIAEVTGTWIFVNDVTNIVDIVTYTWATSNYDYNVIWGDVVNLDATEESIFYIIK